MRTFYFRKFSVIIPARSFYAPYYCKNNGELEDRLLTQDAISDPLNPPTFPCENGEMELDEVPERYFAFLIDLK